MILHETLHISPQILPHPHTQTPPIVQQWGAARGRGRERQEQRCTQREHMRARARKRRSGSRHAHLRPCARARKRQAADPHSLAPAGRPPAALLANGKLRSMALCSCSQTAARRSWDSALCTAPHVLVLAKKVRGNADVLALGTSLLRNEHSQIFKLPAQVGTLGGIVGEHSKGFRNEHTPRSSRFPRKWAHWAAS